jgi:predicted dehydrogenase
MSVPTKKGLSRRSFLNASLLGTASLAFLPRFLSGNTSHSTVMENDIRIGFIGMGRQAMYLLDSFLRIPGVKVVAGCDVYKVKRKRFEKRVTEFYASNKKEFKVETYEKYGELLARSDINTVVIATPDHFHAIIAIAACKSGKDVYLEKPMTFTIKEGQELVKAVRENRRILAMGSQQRSDPNFQHAIYLVQNGAIGEIEKVNAYVGAPPKPYDLPAEEIPYGLNWDLWLGPLNGNIHYNKELNPPISVDPDVDEQFWGGWRWYKEMGGGFTTDWGAHMFDVAQWGLGMDRNGPVEVSPIGDGSEYIMFKYANGVVMTSEPFDETETKGVKFWGSKGWIEVSRGDFKASDSKLIPEKNKDEGPYETKISHQLNFIEAVRERRDPAVPVEIGHSSCTVCTLGNIAVELKKTIYWDPINQAFINDPDGSAAKLLHYQYRSGWKLI